MARDAPGARGFLPTLLLVAFCIAAAMAAASQLTLGFRAWTSEDARRLRVAEHPVALSPLAVVDADGATRTLWDANAHPRAWLVTFVYTRCATICQSLGSEFEQLQAAIAADPTASGVRLVSLSFDRAHDTPQALAGYAHRFHVDPALWTVATPASEAGLARVLRESGVVVIDDGLGGFAHNAAIHVVVPPGRLVAIFGMDRYRDALAYARSLPR